MTDIAISLSEVRDSLFPKEIKYFDFHKRRYAEILSLMNIKKGTRILDIGCSGGHMLLAAKANGAEPYGVDCISDWKGRFKKEKIKFEMCNIEKEKIPFNSEQFDYVIMSEVIEHLLENVDLPLKEAARVLKKDGRLIISTPNACELGKRLLFLFGHNIYFDIRTFYSRDKYKRHNREFTMAELKWLLRKNGFCVRKSRYLSSWEGLREIEKKNLLAKIVSIMQSCIPSFRSNMAVVASKNG